MDQALDFLMSPTYARMAASLAILCLVGAFAALLGAFFHYGRAREGAGADRDAPWVLLMATLRDSLIITVLYVGEAFLYRATDAAGLATMNATSPLQLVSALVPFFDVILLVAIFVVAYLRIIAISSWLRRQS